MVVAIRHQSAQVGPLDMSHISSQSAMGEPEDSNRMAIGGLQCEELEKIVLYSDEDKFF